MAKTIYYKNRKGQLLDNHDVERAFWVVSGHYCWEDEAGYLKFLYGLLGNPIVAVAHPTVEGLLASGSKVQAIKLYREQNECTLCEAKNAVERMISDLDVGGVL